MKSTKQLLRRPVKFIMGIFLVSLAVAIFIICVGQYLATKLTQANLDYRYNTVALLSDTYFWETVETESDFSRVHHSSLPDEIRNWIDELVQTRTDLVKGSSPTGLVSAYIPELSIDNFSQYEYGDSMGIYMDSCNKGNPYRCAMLEVTLTQIGTVVDEDASTFISGDTEQRFVNSVSFLAVGTVESVIGLEQGFESPIGKTIVLTITVSGEEDFEELQLQTGQRYLVYGMDYSDMRGLELETKIMNNKEAYRELFGGSSADPIMEEFDYDQIDPIMEQIDCGLTVCDYSALPWIVSDTDENGSFSGFVAKEDEKPFYYWSDDGDFHLTSAPADDYIADYQVPTIRAMNGRAEDFLSSEEGALWQEALEEMEINNHGFPILAVEKLGYQASFSRDQARIVAGRDFSEAERLYGEKVCIISESLATSNGLQVGDAIQLRAYAYDPNIEVQQLEIRTSKAFPSAAIYSKAMGFTSEMETYTIVGLYRQENAWQNPDDPFGFTPNTIFVPKASVSSEMVPYNRENHSTLIIENGKMEEFKAVMADAGYPDLFICYDSGYREIASSLSAYEEVSVKALYVGIAAYSVLMLLFVILFPGKQGKNLSTMCSLGAPRGKRMLHVSAYSAVILVPGAIIGGLAGALLWEQVAATLMESLNVQIPLEANMHVVAPVLCAAHLVIMMLTVLVVSILLTGNNSVIKRRY